MILPEQHFTKALEREDLAAALALIRCHGININLRSLHGMTILHLAAAKNQSDALKDLLRRGSDLLIKLRASHETAYDVAVRLDKKVAARILRLPTLYARLIKFGQSFGLSYLTINLLQGVSYAFDQQQAYRNLITEFAQESVSYAYLSGHDPYECIALTTAVALHNGGLLSALFELPRQLITRQVLNISFNQGGTQGVLLSMAMVKTYFMGQHAFAQGHYFVLRPDPMTFFCVALAINCLNAVAMRFGQQMGTTYAHYRLQLSAPYEKQQPSAALEQSNKELFQISRTLFSAFTLCYVYYFFHSLLFDLVELSSQTPLFFSSPLVTAFCMTMAGLSGMLGAYLHYQTSVAQLPLSGGIIGAAIGNVLSLLLCSFAIQSEVDQRDLLGSGPAQSSSTYLDWLLYCLHGLLHAIAATGIIKYVYHNRSHLKFFTDHLRSVNSSDGDTPTTSMKKTL